MKPKQPEISQETTQTAVLERLLDPLAQCLTVTTARKILSLRADPIAQERIDELADKSNEGRRSKAAGRTIPGRESAGDREPGPESRGPYGFLV